VRRIAGAITEDIALAAYLAEQVEQAPDFELLAVPQLSIVCFRYVPDHLQPGAGESNAQLNAELDELNTNIMNAVQRGAHAYLSSANIAGQFALRACITNFRTTCKDIDETLGIIRQAAKELAAD
jgi:glutamate/tyrosine decarboxylase-like PLP-dependent enzyme